MGRHHRHVGVAVAVARTQHDIPPPAEGTRGLVAHHLDVTVAARAASRIYHVEHPRETGGGEKHRHSHTGHIDPQSDTRPVRPGLLADRHRHELGHHRQTDFYFRSRSGHTRQPCGRERKRPRHGVDAEQGQAVQPMERGRSHHPFVGKVKQRHHHRHLKHITYERTHGHTSSPLFSPIFAPASEASRLPRSMLSMSSRSSSVEILSSLTRADTKLR